MRVSAILFPILAAGAIAVAGCVTAETPVASPAAPVTVISDVETDADLPLGDWKLRSEDGRSSCSIKLQPLQGYGYGQVWQNGCTTAFRDTPKIASWRGDEFGVTLMQMHGKDAVGHLRRSGSDEFRGRLTSGERVTMTR